MVSPEVRAAKKPVEKRPRTSEQLEELEFRIGGIRETRTTDLLVEVKCTAENRGRLHSAFRGDFAESGSVHHLVSTVEMEILDVDPTVEEEKGAEAIRSYLREEPSRRLVQATGNLL